MEIDMMKYISTDNCSASYKTKREQYVTGFFSARVFSFLFWTWQRGDTHWLNGNTVIVYEWVLLFTQ